MKNIRFYLYSPILFLSFLFLLDKIFSLPFFKNEILTNANSEYYRHRVKLLDKLKNTELKKKLVVAFGDSRAYSYSEIAFDPKRKEIYTVYNFSAPQAVVAYSVQTLQKIISNNIKPSLIILAISPEGFDDNKGIYNSPFFRFGATDEFVEKYFDKFPESEKSEYKLDRLINFRRIEFNYKIFFERLLNGKLKYFSPEYNPYLPILDISNGAQLAYMSLGNDYKALEKDTLRIKNIYLGKNFKIDNTSFYFLEEFLKLAKENRIHVFTVWPRVYNSYKKEYDKFDLDEKFGKRLEALTKKYEQEYFNLNQDLECDEFYDASHQSVSCFGKNMNFFIDKFEKN